MYKVMEENLSPLKDDDNCSEYYKKVISLLCHEINNPLTLINSTIQLIEIKHPEIIDIKYWAQLKNDLKGCIELLENLKEYQNCLNISPTNGNLFLLIKSVVDSFIPLAKQNNVTLVLTIDDISETLFYNYYFDKIRLKQVFTNLIKNAIEATYKNTSGYVYVDCKTDDSNLIIEIIDNGIPISEKHKKYLFSPYSSQKPSGQGLGLPISKSIINFHMGNIDIVSNDEKTNFRITLPKH